jgi:beta-lactam-binding protein with PASTA domain
VPNVTGVRLDAAEKDLKRRSVPYRILASGGSGAAKNSWTVCETNPAPRTHLESGTTVRLIVAPSCKR